MNKTILLITIMILISAIPVIAPIWYGSGNDAGLVGRWSCEGNFNDSSGMKNHGTQSGGVKIGTGVKGRACGFDGVDDYLPTNDALSNPNAPISKKLINV